MFNRRIFLAAAGAWTLAACTTTRSTQQPAVAQPIWLNIDTEEPHHVAPVDLSKIDRRYWRQQVQDPTGEQPGTILIDPQNFFLYHVEEGGTAMRYGVGVGRAGFEWNGSATIARKASWPRWTPPADMIRRQPELVEWRNGMPGGTENPLGARALYLFQNGHDTLYRIHGTEEAWSIGHSVSSGCIRLLNADIIHLHGRVPTGTRVVVRAATPPVA